MSVDREKIDQIHFSSRHLESELMNFIESSYSQQNQNQDRFRI